MDCLTNCTICGIFVLNIDKKESNHENLLFSRQKKYKIFIYEKRGIAKK